MTENKGTMIFTVLLMLAGSIAYMVTGGIQTMESKETKVESFVFKTISFKVAYDPDGKIHLLANSRNNAMANLKAAEGDSIPEEGSIVLGNQEAANLKAAGRFNKVGDRLDQYFGLSPLVEGVLEKKDDVSDDITFFGATQFKNISGESGRVYSKLTAEGVPKIFFRLMANETIPVNFRLARGSMGGYESHNLDGSEYYPLILGAKEAKIMRDEKLFTNTGDSIRNLFGKNFVVVGVLEETGTSLDRMHFVPLYETDLRG